MSKEALAAARAEVARLREFIEGCVKQAIELRERNEGLAAALRALANACECTCGECPCQRIADDALEKFDGEK